MTQISLTTEAAPRPRAQFAHRALGRLRKWGLQRLESLAYDVVGLPMALKRLKRSPMSSPESAPAAYLHDIYGEFYWRLPGSLFKLPLALIFWPGGLLVTVFMFTRRNGAAIRDRTGKSVARQAGEQFMLAARHSIAPYWYYMFEFYDNDRRRAAALYLHRHETKGPAYSLLQPSLAVDAMADKVWFARHCRASGITAVPVLFLLSSGAIAATNGNVVTLPDADIFVKPRVGNGGKNTERWDYLGGGRYRNSKGVVLTREELADRLAMQSLKRDFIVQPRLTNHLALHDVSNGALVTVRLLTCRNETGGFEATDAAFRMAIGKNNLVDNFHAGGIAAKVDMATGELGAATDMGLTPDVGWRETHPVSGAIIRGRRLPLWDEVVALACRAHVAFPHRAIVGWDIAILADGPCIIEGNIKPDLDIHQRVARQPLGDGRAAELLAYNLSKLLARTGQPAR